MPNFSVEFVNYFLIVVSAIYVKYGTADRAGYLCDFGSSINFVIVTDQGLQEYCFSQSYCGFDREQTEMLCKGL